MLRHTLLKLKLKYKSFNYSKHLMVSSIPEDDINQVLNAEKPYEFRKTKFDSIIFFLMNSHSNELQKLEKEYSNELRGAEKELRGVEKKKAEVEKELLKEKSTIEKEKAQVEIKLKDELRGVEKELLKEKSTVEKLTINLLQLRGKLNVRGALEYCRAKILGSKVYFRFEEPFDKALKELEKNEEFIKVLKKKCEESKVREKDVVNCLGGLYHNASKEFHGHDFDAVEIVKKSWTENEIIALASIFTLCEVRYIVLDEFGQPVNPCP
jgi:hypothetical protein